MPAYGLSVDDSDLALLTGPTRIYAGERITLRVESSVRIPRPETLYIFVLGLLTLGLVRGDLRKT